MILVEPQINPAAEAQAIGRVDRIGQKRETTVHRFIIQNTVEERVLEIGRAKARDSSKEQRGKNPTEEKITAAEALHMFEDED